MLLSNQSFYANYHAEIWIFKSGEMRIKEYKKIAKESLSIMRKE